ncbi:hypothetical protein [Bythopirellula goksoeyrii]|uniref:Uncharacterized protein n=1 Tax=Bythopirellula goksoeyrii TaxID=1400387 RepID=A0A5B9QAQ4_9BACT|nr:hypothetical protein [Bythopirellula goksoeyrii]QEG33966.1 hypothetical protein Pr1d_12370 [Bythopirellula goksoeyrii]
MKQSHAPLRKIERVSLFLTALVCWSPELAVCQEEDRPVTSPAPELRGQMVLSVSAELIDELFARDIDKHTSVNRCVLGTRASGSAHTLGRADVVLEPDDNGAAFRVVLKGKSESDTVGRNGPAIIRSRSVTNWEAVKHVKFDGKRFVSPPSTITGNTVITPMGFDSTLPGMRGRIVRRVANRRAGEMRSSAERISQRHTDQELASEVDVAVDACVEKLNQRLHTRPLLTHLLTLLDSKLIEISTNEKSIHFAFEGTDTSLATVCPIDQHLMSEIELWVHMPLLRSPDTNIPKLMNNALSWLQDILPAHLNPAESTNELAVLASLSVVVVEDWVVLRSTPERVASR